MRKGLVGFTLFLSAFGVLSVSASAAIPACVGPVSQETVYTGQGVLESVIGGGSGRLYISGSQSGSPDGLLRRYDAPGADPELVAIGEPGPGGLAWVGRRLLWGYGNTFANGTVGDTAPVAGLYSVNSVNGRKYKVSRTLGMANGIARAEDGSIFGSNSLGENIDRVSPRGGTTNGWAKAPGGNGLTISKNGKYLFVNQMTANPSTIARIEIADPGKVTTYFSAAGSGTESALFDGLTRDAQGNLYAAAWLTGEIWKISRDRRACTVATGISNPSSVAFGGGRKGFRSADLYAVSFGGEIVRIKGARRATFPG